MPLIPVQDPADPRLEPFRDIKERDLVGRRGLFVAEGEVVVRQAVRAARHPLLALLLAEKRAAALADIVVALPHMPAYVASQAVFDAVAGFAVHRGVLAVGRRAADAGAEALLSSAPERAVVVVALGVGNHDNMGGVFRNASAFGAHAVLLGADACDPLYRKAIRVSVGAALTTPFSRLPPEADVVALLERHGFAPLALSPGGGGDLRAFRPPQRAALILGAEGPGLPDSVLARATGLAIPMASGFDSLNVATACGIALHHITSAVSPAPHNDK